MRLIDADPLIEEIASIYGFSISSVRCSLLGSVIANAPTIDIEPKRGEWIETKGGWKCAICDKWAGWASDFCPNCGADMRGADDDRI